MALGLGLGSISRSELLRSAPSVTVTCLPSRLPGTLFLFLCDPSQHNPGPARHTLRPEGRHVLAGDRPLRDDPAAFRDHDGTRSDSHGAPDTSGQTCSPDPNPNPYPNPNPNSDPDPKPHSALSLLTDCAPDTSGRSRDLQAATAFRSFRPAPVRKGPRRPDQARPCLCPVTSGLAGGLHSHHASSGPEGHPPGA